jgi:hypothetical protein
MKGFCKWTDNYTIVALHPRVFQVFLFIFYYREGVALDMYW